MGDYQKAYEEFLADPDRVLGQDGIRTGMDQALECGKGMELPICEVVPWGTTQYYRELS